MKNPKNTRDYGKFNGPRRLFDEGGSVKEPSLTEHLQTGPSWWPEPLGAWMNPPKAAPEKESGPKPGEMMRKAMAAAQNAAKSGQSGTSSMTSTRTEPE